MSPAKPESALAYSYLRFSSPQQASGDSLRRQTEARERWLAAHPNVRLDTSLVMTDAGRSAFRRTDWDAYALAEFVRHVQSGRVKKGSYLLVENLDRLSREDAGDATELFLSIVNKGVVVVQLSPAVMEFRKPVDAMSLMFAIVELSRGHSESAVKSERGKASWGRKQREAGSKLVTRKLPGWVRYDEAARQLVLIPDRAETVRRMFEMARDGYGATAIAKRLNAEKVPVMGRAVVKGRPVAWSGALVWHILTSRATAGEYVPYRRRGADAGEPVPNYFPAVVDANTFHAAGAAIAGRRKGWSREAKHVNLFAGMLTDARDGGTLTYWHTGKHPPVIISVNAKEGHGIGWVSFPAAVLEEAILSQLREIKAADVLAGGGDAAKRVEALAGRVAELDGLIRVWQEKMSNPAIADMVAAKLTEYATERRTAAAELADAQQEAASPLSEAWGEFRSLADLLANDGSDDLRVRVRAALRRAVEGITCLFVRPARQVGDRTQLSSTRLAAARVQFRGSDQHRDYLIVARRGVATQTMRRPATWSVRSFAAPAGIKGELDLRDPKQAAALEKVLGKLGPAELGQQTVTDGTTARRRPRR